MRNFKRTSIASAAATLAVLGSVALGVSPIAAAAHPKPEPAQITATGGDGTAIDEDGTQGSYGDAVQGRLDSDGDQDAFDLAKSEKAAPQEKAPSTNK